MSPIDVPAGVYLLEPAEVYNQALIGVTASSKDHWPRTPGVTVAVYSRRRCIKATMQHWGWDYEEAAEWFEVNTRGAWLGDRTPIFKA